MLFCGVIAGLSRPLFPIGLGMFFFFTNEWLHELTSAKGYAGKRVARRMA
jgi:hypothetical protein